MSLCVIPVLATLVAASARGQSPPTPSADDPAVTVGVDPAESPPNGSITISGLAYPQPGGHVTVIVTPPNAPAVTLSATPDSTGRYHLAFAKTQGTGDYKVSAQMGAKDVPARTQFKIKTYPIDIDEDVADNKALLGGADSVVTAVKHQVADMPDSPAKTALDEKLDALQAETRQLAAQSAGLAAVLQPFKAMVTQHPDAAPVLQPLFDHLAALDTETKEEHEKVETEIAGSGKGGEQCDRIDHATEALKVVPDAIRLAADPVGFARSFAINLGTNVMKATSSDNSGPALDAANKAAQFAGAISPAGSGTEKGFDKGLEGAKENEAENALELAPETALGEKLAESIPESVRSTTQYKFVTAETKRFVPQIVNGANGPLQLMDKVVVLANDVAGFATNAMFAKYCQKFEGPFTATMTAHFFSKPLADGRIVEWWTYTTAVKGKLVLRYPKVAEGAAVALTGQLEGGATHFTYRENVWDAGLYGKMIPNGKVWKADIAPVALDNGTGGVENSLLSPTSFYIPVTGRLADGKITLAIEDATTDFNKTYTVAHTVFMVESPVTTLGIPQFGHFTLPYVGAKFILEHVIKGDYTVGQAGESMSIHRKDTRDFPGNGNDAVYSIALTACNPGCP